MDLQAARVDEAVLDAFYVRDGALQDRAILDRRPLQIVPNTGTLARVPPAIKRSLVSDQVFAALSEAILEGRYAPGEKLPTQRALAADLGVNMASIREAVKRLEQLRLVEVRHGDAMRVSDWRTSGGLDVVAHLLFAAGGVDRHTLGGAAGGAPADAHRGRAAGGRAPHRGAGAAAGGARRRGWPSRPMRSWSTWRS